MMILWALSEVSEGNKLGDYVFVQQCVLTRKHDSR